MPPRPASTSDAGSPLPALTRRTFVKAGGALFVSFTMPSHLSAMAVNQPDVASEASSLESWLEIRSDNTILARTGRTEIGTGMSAFYPQMIAEELRVKPDCITLMTGDTDQTPDGGYSAGFLYGAFNVRKVAAYTYQALLGLASTHFEVPLAALTVHDGIVSAGSKRISYGELLKGQQLDLKIPVTGARLTFAPPGGNSIAGLDWAGMDGLTVQGNPPMKPVSEYKVIGTSYPMPDTRDKVTGQTHWSCDVTLPGMLHARMVRPLTLGSTLLSVGEIDKQRFPTAQVVRKGNLVAVLSPNEWEAVSALRSVAAATRWSTWSGLPGSEHLTQTIRAHAWGAPDASKGDAAKVQAGLANATHTITATYEQPYIKHAPIGPFVAVADVRPDGTAAIWAQSGHLQASRARLANLLGVPMANVVVHWLSYAGQFGRKTFGGDGAEADAVILSQLTGKPVRVQWTLQEDLAWSGASPGWFSDIKGGLDSDGRLIAVHSAFYSPHMFDARPLGAILAGMPAGVSKPGGFIGTEWPYEKIENRLEQVYAMPNVAGDTPHGGLRGLIMRTPGQRQQNFALESLINEAAAVAQTDPIQFRLQHTTDPRLIAILNATATAAGWQPRPSPNPGAHRTGSEPVTGRGVAIMVRANGYWVGIAEVTVIPDTGAVAGDQVHGRRGMRQNHQPEAARALHERRTRDGPQ